jgi:hypothetical protein
MPGHNAQEIVEEALSSWDDVPDLELMLLESDDELDLSGLPPDPPEAA